MFKFYNQSIQYFTRNWCSIYTLFHIVQIQWGVKVPNQFIIDTLFQAEKDKVFYEAWGAYFGRIYKWFSAKIYNRTEIDIQVIAVDINSKEFETLYNKGHAFWLWLKHAWRWYKNAIKDWIINEDDINWDYWVTFWHNHAYYKGFIVDSLWKTGQKPIKMDIETLRKAVKVWLYYPTCRTLYMKDKLLEKYLKMYQRKEVVEDVESLPKAHRVALDRSSKLRVFKK